MEPQLTREDERTRFEAEYGEGEREARRHEWPDDGLPARFEPAAARGSLHPWAVLASRVPR